MLEGTKAFILKCEKIFNVKKIKIIEKLYPILLFDLQMGMTNKYHVRVTIKRKYRHKYV